MKKTAVLLFLLLCVGFVACTAQQNNLVKTGFQFAGKQLKVAIDEVEKLRTGERMFPRSIRPDSSLMLVSPADWTSGFFPGSLWYMYEYTKDNQWRTEAERFTAPIESQKTNGRTHDMGFKIFCSFGNGYRLTENPHYRDVMIESAYTLITRFKPAAGILRSWDHNTDKWQCPVIIDNMMNLELLFWAFRQTNDSTFYKIAVSHAFKTIENHFREDYSTYHVVDFDTLTGQVLNRHTHQGLAHESTWSRGQAWALYGFTMSYRETQEPAFLHQAQQTARFIFNHPNLPQDLIPYWDFDAPEIPNEPRDASAATIAASALYELSLYDKENAAQYLQWANTILQNISAHYLAPLGSHYGFLLLHSTGSKAHGTEVDTPLVYADYYFLEALLRKKKLETTGKLF